jgi:hypothetical protein
VSALGVALLVLWTLHTVVITGRLLLGAHYKDLLDGHPQLTVSAPLSGLRPGPETVISRHRPLTLVWVAVTAQAAFYGIALLFTPFDLNFQLVTSADRLILQLSPCLVLLLGLGLRDLVSGPVAESRGAVHVAA